MKVWIAALLVMAAALALPAPAAASLTSFATFSGTVGVSTDGWGSTSQTGTISASVPAGATVLAAYLYTSTFSNPTLAGATATLAGHAVTFTNLGVNAASCCSLTAGRADVTSIVKPTIDGGAGGVYNFAITEGSSSQDGEALVVVYSLPSLSTTTVGILDGFASVTGDTTSINFTDPLHPANAGFQAQMWIGDGFSYDGPSPLNPTDTGQTSRITVNGTVITQVAGHCDDAADSSCADGNLITVGGFDDPFSPFLPSVVQDHEHYNLVPQIADGSTSIVVQTINASRDDNIFLAVFQVSGLAGINAPPPDSTATPEPGSLLLLASGLAYGARRLKRGRK